LTGLAIGKMLGIGGTGIVFTGPELDSMSDERLQEIAPTCNIFARASPENKLRIVRALQNVPPIPAAAVAALSAGRLPVQSRVGCCTACKSRLFQVQCCADNVSRVFLWEEGGGSEGRGW
jgi:hypothetical protein